MADPAEASEPPLNPVPRSLLDQFLDELAALGVSERQVAGHLVYLRLWQKYLAPARLLDAIPTWVPLFLDFLAAGGVGERDRAFAASAITHFYAFTLDRYPPWPQREAWVAYLATPPPRRPAPFWRAAVKRWWPALQKAGGRQVLGRRV